MQYPRPMQICTRAKHTALFEVPYEKQSASCGLFFIRTQDDGPRVIVARG